MLTTKVVSNKKPPLLSDSESGGSTSLFLNVTFSSIELMGAVLILSTVFILAKAK
ncbi:MAG TPA: hypothetical protein K8V99_07325 [Megamonas funiformis]|nr:hypothetical protein [Megamonas funiformis]